MRKRSLKAIEYSSYEEIPNKCSVGKSKALTTTVVAPKLVDKSRF